VLSITHTDSSGSTLIELPELGVLMNIRALIIPTCLCVLETAAGIWGYKSGSEMLSREGNAAHISQK